ncbi:MAG: glycosyltransferase [Bacteroidales bacterium]|nr:glycosyltransferase [Bacteroidales bacterium]
MILGKAETDMVSVYRNASILAMSSRFEGLPMVLLEAQAAGIPIVSFKCKCGPLDVVTDGVDGFLVEEGDVRGLADKMSILMNDDSLRKRMGAAAYKASDRFDEKKIMAQWNNLFKEL